MDKANFEQHIRLDIKRELSKVTRVNSPHVYSLFHDDKGKLVPARYARLEQRIINMMIAGQIPPAAVIPQIEMEIE